MARLTIIVLVFFSPHLPSLRAAHQAGGIIAGVVTTQEGSLRLPGVELSLVRLPGSTPVADSLSDDQGHFIFTGLREGAYQVTASLEGFSQGVRTAVIDETENRVQIEFNLEVSELVEQLDVVAEGAEVEPTATAQESLAAELINIAPIRGDDFRGLMPLLPGIVRASDGRIVMKGGRPTQSSLVVNSSTNFTDPVTGNYDLNLPSDAIETLDVLPNPYASEFGRFSSGITNIITRQGTNRWRFLINNFLPRLKTRDGAIMGIGGFTPRLSIRGPLIQDRLRVAQTLQYRFLKTRIPGQPDLINDTRLESFDSFTQLDADLSDNHTLSAIVSVFPRKLDFLNLDTFNALPVTANLHQRGHNFGLSERAVLNPTTILESTVSFKRFDADVFGQGFDPMEITPDLNQGNFFNSQIRQTQTLQFVESLTLLREGWGGEHLFKFGFDLLRSKFDGSSASRPVSILRADGTTSQRIDFSGRSFQRARNTDFSIYGQDRWRTGERLILEFGARFDHDGVLGRNNISPRLGAVLGLDPKGNIFLRGGAGYFFDRTPLSVKAFESFENPLLTRFQSDGVTLIGFEERFNLQAGENLRTPHSLTWNLQYDHRVNDHLLFKANLLRRNGHRELLIEPLREGELQFLQLNTRGRSRYWELELTTRIDWDDVSHLIISYVRSRARQDLNGFDEFYGNIRNPIVRENQFSLANVDTPNRFVLRGTFKFFEHWLFSPVLEIRDGFPFSLRNEDQDFVGPRNRGGRFPTLTNLDIDIQRWIQVKRFKARVGVRFFNVLNSFNPRDVQSNIDALGFGTFSNQIPRLIGGTLQLEP